MLFSSWLRNWQSSLKRRWSLNKIRPPRPLASRLTPRPFLETLEDRMLLSTIITEIIGGTQYLTILEPNGGPDGLGAIVRINPSTGTTQLLSDNAICGNEVFNHPTALTLETAGGTGYLTMIDPTGGPDGLGAIVRINPYNGGSQLVSDNAICGNEVYNRPTDIITEITGNGSQYLTFLDPTGGPDGLGSIVRINESNGGSQLVSDNAICGNRVFIYPTALTLETVNGTGYLTMIDPTDGPDGLGAIVRINPDNGGSQLVSDNAICGNEVYHHPFDIITEITGNGSQYLTFLDPTGGPDGLGSIVRINESNGGSQLVSDNAICGNEVFIHPTALTLETANGTGYLTMIDPTGGAEGNGSVVRINPSNGGSQLVSSYAVYVVTTNPTSQTVTAGQDVTFTAAARGDPTPNVQWQVSTDGGNTFSNISGATSTTLVLTNVQASQNGNEYQALFTNSDGHTYDGAAVTSYATLAVQYTPAVTSNPTNQTLSAGSTATFIAAANGNPAPAVQWQVSIDGGKTFSNINGATSTTLTLNNVSLALNGHEYRAVFTNSIGTATTTAATLIVHTAPAFTSGNSATFTVGQGGAFTVTATGSPTPTLTESGALPNGVTFTNNGNGMATVIGIPAAGTNGTYHFTIIAHNGVASDAAQSFILTVNPAPVPPPPPPPPPPPIVPPLLQLFNEFLGGFETMNANGTTITDNLFGFPMVETYDYFGSLVSVTLLGFDITFLFG